MGVVFHLEDSTRVGIYPSHLDEWRQLWIEFGHTEFVVIDQTTDGYFGTFGPEYPLVRFKTIEDWWDQSGKDLDSVVVLETLQTIERKGAEAVSIDDYVSDDDAWVVVGPSNGLAHFIDEEDSKTFVYIPTVTEFGLHSGYAGAIAASRLGG